MPEGALLTETVESLVCQLAQTQATGCLLLRNEAGVEAEVFLRGGAVYAVIVPGRRVLLGVRLMSRGALTPEALAEALQIQRTELQGWRLGELLVHLGYVDVAMVEEFVVEQLKDALAELLGWPVAAWKFRRNKKTRQDVAPPMPVPALICDLRAREVAWQRIVAATGGAAAVPTLGSAPPAAGSALGPNEWAMLCRVDGTRDVAELAAECGFTLFEAGEVLLGLVTAGLLSVPEPPAVARTDASLEPEGPAPAPEQVRPAAVDTETCAEERLLTLTTVPDPDLGPTELVLPVVPLPPQAETAGGQSAAEVLAAEQAAGVETARLAGERAVAAAQRLGTAAQAARHTEHRRRAGAEQRLRDAELLHLEMEALAQRAASDRAERSASRRRAKAEQQQAAAAEAQRQADRQRDLEAAAAERAAAEQSDRAAERAAAEEGAWAEHAQWLAAERSRVEAEAWQDHTGWLAAQRATAEEPAWAEHAAWLTAERVAVEEQAWAEHATWLKAERAAVEHGAWAEHAAWLAAERAAVEEQAWAEHAAWLAAERAAVEGQAWAEHVVWVAAAAAAELAVAEAAAWADHRVWLADREAERASREAALRVARERAEQELAEEAARRAQRQAEQEVRREAERIAAAEAVRLQREDADRLAAEAAEAIAAAEAERIRRELQAQLELEQAAAERAAAAEARAAAERAAAEQARAEVERARALAEAEQAQAERAAAKLAAAEQARAEAERAQAERAAAEQARAEAERAAAKLAAAEQARAEAERAEAERAAAERAAAERAQAERVAAERAAAERAQAEQPPTAAAQTGQRTTADAAAGRTQPGPSQRAATNLLTELTSTTPVEVPAQPAGAGSPPGETQAPAAEDLEPAPRVERDHSDTAMLLRELSSLGFGPGEGPRGPGVGAAGATPAPTAGRPPAGSGTDKKRRKGLFGRG